MELPWEIGDLYPTWLWVRVRKSFITPTSWVWVQFGARSTIWSTSSYSRKFYNLGPASISTEGLNYTFQELLTREMEKRYILNFEPVCLLTSVFSRNEWRFLSIKWWLTVYLSILTKHDCERNSGNTVRSLSLPLLAVLKSRLLFGIDVFLIHLHLQTGRF